MCEYDRFNVVPKLLSLAPLAKVCVDKPGFFNLLQTMFKVPVTVEHGRLALLDLRDLPHEADNGIVPEPEVIGGGAFFNVIPGVTQVQRARAENLTPPTHQLCYCQEEKTSRTLLLA